MAICIDCLQDKTATVEQEIQTYDGRVNSWHICRECLAFFEAQKADAAREWKEREQELRAALARVPFGQVSPKTMRRKAS